MLLRGQGPQDSSFSNKISDLLGMLTSGSLIRARIVKSNPRAIIKIASGRLNPNTKFALYLQGMPGSQLQGEVIDPAEIRVFKNLGHLTEVPLQALSKGQRVKPIDVIVSAND